MAIAAYPAPVSTGDTGHAALHNAVDADLSAHKTLLHPQTIADLLPALNTAPNGLVLTTTGVSGGIALSELQNGNGGTIIGTDSLSATIQEGAVVQDTEFTAGLMSTADTVLVGVEVVAQDAAGAGASATITWYKKGPSTSWLKNPIGVTSVLGAPVSGVPQHEVNATGLAVALRNHDTIIPRWTSVVGTAVPGNIDVILRFDRSIVLPSPPGPPTGVTASIAGQSAGSVLVSWIAPSLPTGNIPSVYTVTPVDPVTGIASGTAQTVAWGASSLVMTGQAAVSTKYSVTVTTNAGISAAGVSGAVTPAAPVATNALTTRERQGQDWGFTSGPGNAVYDAGYTPPSSTAGVVGSLKFTATGAGTTLALTAFKSAVAGETKTISARFHNPSAHDQVVFVNVVYLDGSGSFAGDSGTAVGGTCVAGGDLVVSGAAHDSSGTAASRAMQVGVQPTVSGDIVAVSDFILPV